MKLSKINVLSFFRINKLFVFGMNKTKLIIFKFKEIYNILFEIKDFLKLDIFFVESELEVEDYFKTNNHYIVLDREKNSFKNQLIINEFPITIFKLVQKINKKILNINFKINSKLKIGNYFLDLNSKEIYKEQNKVELTLQEIKILLYLNGSQKFRSINDFYKNIWEYKHNLETHTVETHIYRLRKKIAKGFNDKNFIISSKDGYYLNKS